MSHWGECVYDAHSWKERRLLCQTRVILIERPTSIMKMVERDVFYMKPKHQYHLSQEGECVYDAQSWKKKRLFC